MESPSLIPLDLDMACSVEEPCTSARSKVARQWKHRRSRSTSNLAIGGGGNFTESDESKDANDSDYAERSLAKLTLHGGGVKGSIRSFKKPQSALTIPTVESDSFNELYCGASKPQTKLPQSKRRRRYKRMAIEDQQMDDNDSQPSIPDFNGMEGVGETLRDVRIDDKSPPLDPLDVGKRKRQQGQLKTMDSDNLIVDKVSENSSFTGGAPEGESIVDADMQDDSSSLSSEDEAGNLETCDDGQEGDDEHSDWIGDEWLEDPESERRRALIMSRIQTCAPLNREIRAGRRRVLPHKPPVFSIRTSANEQLSKFLQNPEQSEIKLHPMRKDERAQLSHIASLYSLQMRLKEGSSSQDFSCPVLTKTPHTQTMLPMDEDTSDSNNGFVQNSKPNPWPNENDTKRIKK